jgi:hypothetical protein
MVYRKQRPHILGMDGRPGWEWAAKRLDELARHIASPLTSRRGWMARVHYLLSHRGGELALRQAGVTVTQRTLKRWQAGRQVPRPGNLERIEAAYTGLRRRNVAASLIRRLNRGGRGTAVEIFPHDQSGVAQPHRRWNVATYRRVNVRHWEDIVESWAEQDEMALRGAWEDAVLDEIGSDWGGYEFCNGVGFAA